MAPGLGNDSGAASPYPSNIFVSNLPGTVYAVTVTLTGFSTKDQGDLLSLLAGPGGNSLDFFSLTGSNVSNAPSPFNLTFSDTASSRVTGNLVSAGTFLPTDLPSDRWIRAVDFKAGNRKVVHHIIAGIDTSGKARQLDEKDPKPGYSSVGGFGDGVPLRGFLPIWTPGRRPRYTPEGAGYVLPSKADVLIQLHYHKNGKVETDATSIGLYLSDKTLPKEIRTAFVFPEISSIQGLALTAKTRAAQAAGKRLSLDETLSPAARGLACCSGCLAGLPFSAGSSAAPAAALPGGGFCAVGARYGRAGGRTIG